MAIEGADSALLRQAAKASQADLSALFDPSSEFWLALREAGIEEPGLAYESLLRAQKSSRKASGSYYTPPALVETLLDRTLDPLLPDSSEALLSLRVCDPACGVGHFLIPAARRLAARLASVGALAPEEALRQVVKSCVFGVDTDEMAAELCRRALSGLAGGDDLSANVRCADSLEAFPFEGQRFDLVLGNPPFVNAIERKGKDARAASRRAAFPELGGTADLSSYFLALAARIVRPGGWIGIVLPRSVLNAPSADRLRAQLNLRFLYMPTQSDLFKGASVFICLAGIGPPGPCVWLAPSGVEETIALASDNWWLAACGGEDPKRAGATRLGGLFEVSASMTAGDAYDCLPYLEDRERGGGFKFLTTGLIEPGESLWGRRECRYLRRLWAYPRLPSRPMTRSLDARLDRARRPKILVAGLSSRIECLLDPSGETVGAVSTFSIYSPRDEIEALTTLAERLLSPEATDLFRAELGANAMGGGNITMRASFLRNFPF